MVFCLLIRRLLRPFVNSHCEEIAVTKAFWSMLPMKNWSFLPLFVLGICFFALLAPVFCVAQTSPDLEQGVKPYGAYQGGNIDSVGLANGNVMAHIPMASYPQRGGKLRLNFFARYNNKSWTVGHTSAVPPAYFWT